jgi:hypothetical protein
MSIFAKSVAQYVSAYLAIIRYIKIVGEIAEISHTAVTHVDTFS